MHRRSVGLKLSNLLNFQRHHLASFLNRGFNWNTSCLHNIFLSFKAIQLCPAARKTSGQSEKVSQLDDGVLQFVEHWVLVSPLIINANLLWKETEGEEPQSCKRLPELAVFINH